MGDPTMKNFMFVLTCAFALCFAGNAFADDALSEVEAAYGDAGKCAKGLKGCYKEGRGDAGKTKNACKSLRDCKKSCKAENEYN